MYIVYAYVYLMREHDLRFSSDFRIDTNALEAFHGRCNYLSTSNKMDENAVDSNASECFKDKQNDPTALRGIR